MGGGGGASLPPSLAHGSRLQFPLVSPCTVPWRSLRGYLRGLPGRARSAHSPTPPSCFQLATWQRGSWPRGLESGQNPPVPSFQILFDFIFSDTRVLYTVDSITSDLPKHTSPSFANRLGLRVMIRDAPKFQNPRTGRWSNQAT